MRNIKVKENKDYLWNFYEIPANLSNNLQQQLNGD